MNRNHCLLIALLLAVTVLMTSCSADPVASGHPSEKDGLAIFAVGFTDVENGSARLVFSTNQPTRSQVKADGASRPVISTMDEPSEIHAHLLEGLAADRETQVTIEAADSAGRIIRSGPHAIVARTRPAQFDSFKHRMLIGVSHGANPWHWEQLGIGAYRIEVTWARLQPAAGVTDMDYLAAVVRSVEEMRRLNIEPLILLCYSVPWTKEWTDRQMTWRRPEFGPPDHLADWKNYVRMVMEALRGKARLYEIWNEPDAGYLATGDFVERPHLPPPIGRPPFQDNHGYWLGDRYVPLVRAAREVADEIDPRIALLNGGWNRDYHGWRAEMVFQRGLARYIQQYAIHNYAGAPFHFDHWHHMTHDRYFTHIDRVFAQFDLDMPIAVTEWGTEISETADGTVTESDRQQFLLKSVFYFLSLERVNVLILHALAAGDRFSLIDPGSGAPTASYHTFGWLSRTFSGREYRAQAVEATGDENVQAHAVRLTAEGAVYVAVWSLRPEAGEGATPAPLERVVSLALPIEGGNSYRLQTLDARGEVVSEASVAAHSGHLRWQQKLRSCEPGREPPVALIRLTPR
jgi:hypothetical protein